MKDSYLDALNPAQKEAVLKTEGPLLIVAGAGAGKTKTIVFRILHLVKTGVRPQNILAITFTNKAAKEMRDRVMALLAKEGDAINGADWGSRPHVSTFHSLGVQILKENASILGIPRHFAIFDKTDSKKAVRDAIAAAHLDPKQYEPSKFQSIISREKGNFVTVSEYSERTAGDYFAGFVSEVWQHYEKTLREEKALDFDDLLLKTALLLQKNDLVREHYRKVWTHIHIDEYQDTNKVQYMIAKLLTGESMNICVVGDSDQNIYSWRGAQLRNILNFERDFPGARTILLEQNYRSTKTIIAAANTIIKKNKFRNEKHLFTENADGEKIVRFQGFDEQDEARFVSAKAEELVRSGVDPNEIAVLYRANYQSRALEEAFLGRGVPYQVLGVRFFERKEVKDVLSYIKVSLNPDCLSDLKRVINVPARGVGKVTLLKILEGQKDTLAGQTRKNVDSFFELLKRIKNAAAVQKPSELVKFVIREAGFEELFGSKHSSEEDEERLGNIKELASLASKFDSEPGEAGLEKFLTEAALQSDQDELSEVKRGVKLLTVHASKGLEFDFVFITGLEHGLFPSSRSHTDAVTEESEEERRLFYVALTRARKRVYLTNTEVRTLFGSRQINIPSEFLGDIDDELVEQEESEQKPDRAEAIRKIFTIDF